MKKDETNPDSNEESGEPLYSIVTTNTIKPSTESAFSSTIENAAKTAEKARVIPAVPIEDREQLTEGVEKPVKKLTPTSTPTPVKKEKTVYELTYINEADEEFTIYSFAFPIFDVDRDKSLTVVSFFGKEVLYENVLGLTEVRSMCSVEFDVDTVNIDLTKGLVIKVIKEEPWMSLSYEETKKLFDEAVLKAYRQASTTQAPIQSGPKRKVPQNKQVVQNSQHIGHVPPGDGFPVGNIPVNRGPLIDF